MADQETGGFGGDFVLRAEEVLKVEYDDKGFIKNLKAIFDQAIPTLARLSEKISESFEAGGKDVPVTVRNSSMPEEQKSDVNKRYEKIEAAIPAVAETVKQMRDLQRNPRGMTDTEVYTKLETIFAPLARLLSGVGVQPQVHGPPAPGASYPLPIKTPYAGQLQSIVPQALAPFYAAQALQTYISARSNIHPTHSELDIDLPSAANMAARNREGRIRDHFTGNPLQRARSGRRGKKDDWVDPVLHDEEGHDRSGPYDLNDEGEVDWETSSHDDLDLLEPGLTTEELHKRTRASLKQEVPARHLLESLKLLRPEEQGSDLRLTEKGIEENKGFNKALIQSLRQFAEQKHRDYREMTGDVDEPDYLEGTNKHEVGSYIEELSTLLMDKTGDWNIDARRVANHIGKMTDVFDSETSRKLKESASRGDDLKKTQRTLKNVVENTTSIKDDGQLKTGVMTPRGGYDDARFGRYAGIINESLDAELKQRFGATSGKALTGLDQETKESLVPALVPQIEELIRKTKTSTGQSIPMPTNAQDRGDLLAKITGMLGSRLGMQSNRRNPQQQAWRQSSSDFLEKFTERMAPEESQSELNRIMVLLAQAQQEGGEGGDAEEAIRLYQQGARVSQDRLGGMNLKEIEALARKQLGKPRGPISGVTTSKSFLDRLGLQISGRKMRKELHQVAGFTEPTTIETEAAGNVQGRDTFDEAEMKRLMQEAFDQVYSQAKAYHQDEAEATRQADKASEKARDAYLAEATKGYNDPGNAADDPNYGIGGDFNPKRFKQSLSDIERNWSRAGNPNTRRLFSTVQSQLGSNQVPHEERIVERGLFRESSNELGRAMDLVRAIAETSQYRGGSMVLNDEPVSADRLIEMQRDQLRGILKSLEMMKFSTRVSDRGKVTGEGGETFPFHDLRKGIYALTGKPGEPAVNTSLAASLSQQMFIGRPGKDAQYPEKLNHWANTFVARSAVTMGGRDIAKDDELSRAEVQELLNQGADRGLVRKSLKPRMSDAEHQSMVADIENVQEGSTPNRDQIIDEYDRMMGNLVQGARRTMGIDARSKLPTRDFVGVAAPQQKDFYGQMISELGLRQEVNTDTGKAYGDTVNHENFAEVLRRVIDKNYGGTKEYTEALQSRSDGGLSRPASIGLDALLRKIMVTGDVKTKVEAVGDKTPSERAQEVDVKGPTAAAQVPRFAKDVQSTFDAVFKMLSRFTEMGWVDPQGFEAYKQGNDTRSVQEQLQKRKRTDDDELLYQYFGHGMDQASAAKGVTGVPIDAGALKELIVFARQLQQITSFADLGHAYRGSLDEVKGFVPPEKNQPPLVPKETEEIMHLDDARDEELRRAAIRYQFTPTAIEEGDGESKRQAAAGGNGHGPTPPIAIAAAGGEEEPPGNDRGAGQAVQREIKEVASTHQVELIESNIQVLERLFGTLSKFSSIDKVSLVNLEGIGRSLNEFIEMDKALDGVNKNLSRIAQTVSSIDPRKFSSMARDLRDAAKVLSEVNTGNIAPVISPVRAAAQADPVVRLSAPTTGANGSQSVKPTDLSRLLAVNQDIKNILNQIRDEMGKDETGQAQQISIDTSGLFTETTGSTRLTEISSHLLTVDASINRMSQALAQELQSLNQAIATGFSTLAGRIAPTPAPPAPAPPSPPRPAGGGGGGGGGGRGAGGGRRRRRGGDEEGEEEASKTPLDYDITDQVLQRVMYPNFNRQATGFETERTVQQSTRPEPLQMELVQRMLSTQLNRGRFLQERVSADKIVRGLFEMLKQVTTDTGGSLVNPETGEDVVDLKGMGFNHGQRQQLRAMDFSRPLQPDVPQQMQTVSRLASDQERFIAAMRAARAYDPNAGTQFGIHNDREIFGKQEVLYNLRDQSGAAMKTMSVTTDEEGKTMVKSLTTSSNAMEQFERATGSALKRVILWGGASFAIYGVVQQFQKMVAVAADVDTKLHKLEFLMNSTATNFDDLGKAAFQASRDFGVSVGETLDAMVIFAQQGRTQSEVINLVRASLAAANQTELTATAATEALTAAMATFGTESTDALRIVDAWSSLANKSATTAIVLADAMKKVGASARLVGVDFHQFNAMVATVNEATRKSGSEIGTALKFIFQSVQSPQTIKSLEQMGVAVFQSAGQMRPFMDILRDLHDRMESLNDVQQTSALRTVASRRHYADLAILLKNFDDVQRHVAESTDSFGVATRNNDIVMESFAKQIAVMKTNFAEAGNAIAQSGIMTGLLGISRMMSTAAGAAKSLPGSVTGAVTIIGALAYGLNLLSRAAIGLGGQGIPSFTRALQTSGVAQKLLATESKATMVALLSEANAMELVAQKARALPGMSPGMSKHLESPEGQRVLLSRTMAATSEKYGTELTTATATPEEQSVGKLSAGYVGDQKRFWTQTGLAVGGFAAAAFLSSFSAKLREKNEYGDIGTDMAANIAEGLQKATTGMSLGAMFGGGKGALVGAGLGAAWGVIDFLNEFSNSNEKALKSTKKFAEGVRSQIDAVRQLQREIAGFQEANTERDPLTNKIEQQEFPKNNVAPMVQRYAQAIAQLGKMQATGTFNPADKLKDSLGANQGTDFGIPLNNLTKGLSDVGNAGKGLDNVITALRKVLDDVSKSNAANFFAQVRKEMDGLAESSRAYAKALENPKLTTLLGGGVSGHRSWAALGDLVGAHQFAKNERSRADALEQRGAMGSLFGQGAGYNNADIAQTAGGARDLDKLIETFNQTTDYLRGMQVKSPTDRMDLARKGMEDVLPGIVSMGATQFTKAGINPDTIKNYQQLAEATDKLAKSSGSNKIAVAMLQSFTDQYAKVMQAMASRGLGHGATMDDLEHQMEFNKQEGYPSSLATTFDRNGKVDEASLADRVGPGIQTISKQGNQYMSAIVDSMDDNGKLNVIVSRQEKVGGQMRQIAVDVVQKTSAEYARMAAEWQKASEKFQVANPGVNSRRFFSGIVEDIEKEIRDVVVSTERVMAIYRKQIAEYTNQLRMAQTVTRDTAPSIANKMEELTASVNLSKLAARQVFGSPDSLKINTVYTKPYNLEEEVAKVTKNQPGLSSLAGINLTSQPTDLKQSVDAGRAAQSENTRATHDLTKSISSLNDTILRETIKQLGATTPTVLQGWRGELDNLEKATRSGDAEKSKSLLKDFLESAGDSHLNLDRAQVYADYAMNPMAAIAGLRSKVEAEVPVDQVLKRGLLPTSFDAIGKSITASALTDQPAGLKQIRDAYSVVSVMLNKFGQELLEMQKKDPAARLASTTLDQGKRSLVSLKKDVPGLLPNQTDEETGTWYDELVKTNDPQKLLRASTEMAQNIAGVDEQISERAFSVLDKFSSQAGTALATFASSLDKVNRSKALDQLLDSFQIMAQFGKAGVGLRMFAQQTLNPKDLWGRGVEPEKYPIVPFARGISQRTGVPYDAALRAVTDQVKAAPLAAAGMVYGKTEDTLDTLGKKFSVWKDMDVTTESVNTLKKAIDQLLETTNLDKNSEAVKKLMGIWDQFEDKRRAQQNFFESTDTRLVKNYAEQLIGAGAAPEAFSDQLRGVIKGDSYLQRKGIEAGIIPGINEGDIERANAQLNDTIDNYISPGYDALQKSSGQFDQLSAGNDVNFAATLDEDPRLADLRDFIDNFVGRTLPLNFTASLSGDISESAQKVTPPQGTPIPFMHSGDIAADETPAILRKGEAVIPSSLVPMLPQNILRQLGTSPSGLKTIMGTVLPMFHGGLDPGASEVNLGGMSRQDYVKWLVRNYHIARSENSLYKMLIRRPEFRGMSEKDVYELPDPRTAKAYDAWGEAQARNWTAHNSGEINIPGVKTVGEGAYWQNYQVGNGHYSGHKGYLTFNTDQIPTHVTPDRLNEFMGKLAEAGYNGQVKIPDDGYRAFSSYDNIVMHGANQDEVSKALQVAREFWGATLQHTATGEDRNGRSYNDNLVKEVLRQRSAAKKETVADQPPPPPTAPPKGTTPAPEEPGKPDDAISFGFEDEDAKATVKQAVEANEAAERLKVTPEEVATPAAAPAVEAGKPWSMTRKLVTAGGILAGAHLGLPGVLLAGGVLIGAPWLAGKAGKLPGALGKLGNMPMGEYFPRLSATVKAARQSRKWADFKTGFMDEVFGPRVQPATPEPMAKWKFKVPELIAAEEARANRGKLNGMTGRIELEPETTTEPGMDKGWLTADKQIAKARQKATIKALRNQPEPLRGGHIEFGEGASEAPIDLESAAEVHRFAQEQIARAQAGAPKPAPDAINLDTYEPPRSAVREATAGQKPMTHRPFEGLGDMLKAAGMKLPEGAEVKPSDVIDLGLREPGAEASNPLNDAIKFDFETSNEPLPSPDQFARRSATPVAEPVEPPAGSRLGARGLMRGSGNAMLLGMEQLLPLAGMLAHGDFDNMSAGQIAKVVGKQGALGAGFLVGGKLLQGTGAGIGNAFWGQAGAGMGAGIGGAAVGGLGAVMGIKGMSDARAGYNEDMAAGRTAAGVNAYAVNMGLNTYFATAGTAGTLSAVGGALTAAGIGAGTGVSAAGAVLGVAAAPVAAIAAGIAMNQAAADAVENAKRDAATIELSNKTDSKLFKQMESAWGPNGELRKQYGDDQARQVMQKYLQFSRALETKVDMKRVWWTLGLTSVGEQGYRNMGEARQMLSSLSPDKYKQLGGDQAQDDDVIGAVQGMAQSYVSMMTNKDALQQVSDNYQKQQAQAVASQQAAQQAAAQQQVQGSVMGAQYRLQQGLSLPGTPSASQFTPEQIRAMSQRMGVANYAGMQQAEEQQLDSHNPLGISDRDFVSRVTGQMSTISAWREKYRDARDQAALAKTPQEIVAAQQALDYFAKQGRVGTTAEGGLTYADDFTATAVRETIKGIGYADDFLKQYGLTKEEVLSGRYAGTAKPGDAQDLSLDKYQMMWADLNKNNPEGKGIGYVPYAGEQDNQAANQFRQQVYQATGAYAEIPQGGFFRLEDAGRLSLDQVASAQEQDTQLRAAQEQWKRRMRSYHTGGVATEDQVAILKKGEPVIPAHLVPELPQELLNKIPGGSAMAVERMHQSAKTEQRVENNQQNDIKVPVNVQVVVDGKGRGSSPEEIREIIGEALRKEDILKKILDAPLSMLMR